MITYVFFGIAAFISLCLVLFVGRLVGLVYKIRSRRRDICSKMKSPTSLFPAKSCRLMVVLGSGGHTAEMLTLVQDVLTQTKQPACVTYLVGATDAHSAEKAVKLHTEATNKQIEQAKVNMIRLPRAREVGQSWSSSMISTARTFVAALRIVAAEKPDLVICNGPGTSAVVAVCALLLRAWKGTLWGKVVYVESFARVVTLSLSGKLVYQFADRFVVQWESLTKYKLAEYYGRLC